MAGQIQIRNLNSERLYGEALEEMHTQLDWWHLKDKFALKTKYDKTRFLHAQLMESILCTNSCELENWIKLKIEGKLDDSQKTKHLIRTDYFTDIERAVVNLQDVVSDIQGQLS